MKLQVRRGVFETNSSSTHSLTLYEKDEWEEFKNGETVIDESWHSDNSPAYKTREDVKMSDAFKKWLEKNYGDKVNDFDEEQFSNVLDEFMYDECIYDYETYSERYEVLEKEIPGSDYVAVSIFSYE